MHLMLQYYFLISVLWLQFLYQRLDQHQVQQHQRGGDLHHPPPPIPLHAGRPGQGRPLSAHRSHGATLPPALHGTVPSCRGTSSPAARARMSSGRGSTQLLLTSSGKFVVMCSIFMYPFWKSIFGFSSIACFCPCIASVETTLSAES